MSRTRELMTRFGPNGFATRLLRNDAVFRMVSVTLRTYPLQEVTGGAGDQSPVAAAAGRSCVRPAGPSYRRHRPAVPAAWPACGAPRGGPQGAARPWSEDVPAQNSLFSHLRYRNSRKKLCSGQVLWIRIRGSVQKSNLNTCPNLNRGIFLCFFFLPVYCIQHCFIYRPSDSTVSEDAGIELTHFLSMLFCTDSANFFYQPPSSLPRNRKRWRRRKRHW